MAGTTKTLVNRDISWLQFNARLLQEASDPTTPLIERMRFLGIYSNNLDEFYRVRVATLTRMTTIEKKTVKDNVGFNPKKILKQIAQIAVQQAEEFNQIFQQTVEELAAEGIHIINEQKLSEKQGTFIRKYFNENIRSRLFPMLLSSLKPATLKDNDIYLAVNLAGSSQKVDSQFALIKLPVDDFSRFIVLPPESGKQYIILLDDVIRFNLKEIFGVFGYDTFKSYAFKFTRDSEMDLDSDVSKSFLETMAESLKQRISGAATRFTYDADMPEKLLNKMAGMLEVESRDNLIAGGVYHNFKDFMSFPDLGREDLLYQRSQPLDCRKLPRNQSIFKILKKTDVMLHFPYQSFRYIIDFLREASIDPHVRSIKMTLYRVASDSSVVNALINAARNGKSVTVFLELQARFDEKANIRWAEKLQDEGVKVIHGIPGVKVHSKILLIRRKENGVNVYYANIATGNFNEKTARVYTDDSLLTSNKEITADLYHVFEMFESKYLSPKFKKIVVSPFHLRNTFMRLMQNEIKNAQAGKEAWILAKLNSLTDEKIAQKLYQAGQAGVKIDILCRGACNIIPQIPGLSENIRVMGVVDKFLEHTRVFIFCNGGNEKYYIGSADWMTRNLDNRIEVMTPILDKGIQQELKTMLMIQMKDNKKLRLVNSDPPNAYANQGTKPAIRSQIETYKYLKDK